MPTEKYLRGGTLSPVLNTGATLASNSLAIGATVTIADAGYILGDVVFRGTFATAPGANTGISLWLLRDDGAATPVFEDGSASIEPARRADVVIPVRAATTAQVVILPAVLPPGPFKGLAKNDGTAATLNGGWTVEVRPHTYQSV